MHIKQKSKVLLFGAGGQAAKMASAFTQMEQIVLGHFADTVPIGRILLHPYLGQIPEFKNWITNQLEENIGYSIAIGDPCARRRLSEYLENLLANQSIQSVNCFGTQAILNPNSKIGLGNYIGHHAILETHSQVGDHCLIDAHVLIEHDCSVGNYVNLSPRVTLCGGVIVNDQTFIGAHAVITENVTIGMGSIVGAGAVVTQDLPPLSVAVGIPAKIIKKRKLEDPIFRP